MNQVKNIEGSEVFEGGWNPIQVFMVPALQVVAGGVKKVHVENKWRADNIWTEAVV